MTIKRINDSYIEGVEFQKYQGRVARFYYNRKAIYEMDDHCESKESCVIFLCPSFLTRCLEKLPVGMKIARFKARQISRSPHAQSLK